MNGFILHLFYQKLLFKYSLNACYKKYLGIMCAVER